MTECYLAVDIGSTKLSAAVVGDRGDVLVRDRIQTPARDVWPSLARLVSRVVAAAPSPPLGCGAGCSGPVDVPAGTVSPLRIPALADFPLSAQLAELTGLDTVVGNNATALALGEAWCGAALGQRNFVGLLIGGGVNGGIVLGGRPLDGRLGNAGNIAHLVVEPEGRPCACGGRGCLEAYCGGVAIEAETGRPPQRAPQAIVERSGQLVGRALASLAAVCDLRLAVIGGSVALGFGQPFFDAVRSELEQRARLAFTTGFRVVPAGLGEMAPLVGAAALVRRRGTALR